MGSYVLYTSAWGAVSCITLLRGAVSCIPLLWQVNPIYLCCGSYILYSSAMRSCPVYIPAMSRIPPLWKTTFVLHIPDWESYVFNIHVMTRYVLHTPAIASYVLHTPAMKSCIPAYSCYDKLRMFCILLQWKAVFLHILAMTSYVCSAKSCNGKLCSCRPVFERGRCELYRHAATTCFPLAASTRTEGPGRGGGGATGQRFSDNSTFTL